MKQSISKILKGIGDLKTRPEKIEALRANASNKALTQVLYYALDPSVKWALPEGDPPYTPWQYPDQEGRLYQEARRLYLFVEGGHPGLNPLKRESLFIQLLESIDQDDAKLLLSVKSGKIPFKGINEALVREALPGLLNEKVTA